MLWEVTWALIDEHGYDADIYSFTGDVAADAGNVQALALVTEGMKLIQSSNHSCIIKLKAIIELHVRISSQNIYGMASLNNDWMHLEEKLEYYQKLRIDYEDDFRAILKHGIASGEILTVNPEVMMFSILTTLRSLYIWIPKKEDLNLEELSNTLNQILIKGINK